MRAGAVLPRRNRPVRAAIGRLLLGGALGLAGLAWSRPGAACGTNTTPCVMAGRAFVDSVGVNTHFVDRTSVYAARSAELVRLMQQAHIRHVRDSAINLDGAVSPDDNSGLFAAMGRSGIRADFVTGFGIHPDFLARFRARVAPAAEAFELPNEGNDGTHPDWLPDTRQMLSKVRTYSSGTPVIGPSLVILSAGRPGDNPYETVGNHAGDVDYGNVHDYFAGFNPGTSGWGNGAAPPCQGERYGAIPFSLCAAAALSGRRPVMVTEFGYGTDQPRHTAVPEDIQSRYLLRGLLLHAMAGVTRTYLYQLADSGTDDGAKMGIIRGDLSAKPAYAALSSLLGMADDEDAVGSSASIHLSGEVDSIATVLLARRHGPSRLVVWVERPGFDPNARGGAGAVTPVTPQAVTVTVTSPGLLGQVRSLADDGRWTDQAAGGRTSLPVILTDRLTVIDVVQR